MSLWDVLTVCSGAVSFGAALAAAAAGEASGWPLFAAGSMALVSGVGAIALVRSAGRLLVPFGTPRARDASDLRLRLVYAGAVAWIPVAALVSATAVSWLVDALR